MATHFKWYGSNTQTVVPMNAVYTYPSQANKTVKSTPRLPPKNGDRFTAGRDIRIELPAMGYINGGNTVLAFDVDLKYTPVLGDTSIIRFQNNIQSLFNRASVMYGSTPVEDIPDYNQIVRSMTEWTTTGDFDQGTINDGIGHSTLGVSGYVPTSFPPTFDDIRSQTSVQKVNVRQAYVHGISLQKRNESGNTDDQKVLGGDGYGIVPYIPEANVPSNSNTLTTNEIIVTRRYVVQLNLGLLLQGKLLPVKYMASQLAIVLRTASNEDAIYWQKGYAYDGTIVDAAARFTANYNTAKSPSYEIKNVALIPEILEFDSSYDSAMLEGLQQGVPLLFSSFNGYKFATAQATTQTLAIPERNRSIKSVFTMQKRAASDFAYDSGATFYTTGLSGISSNVLDNNTFIDVGSTLQEYQYRIGGRMFPASPVQCSLEVAGSQSNGAGEAYHELAKALNTVGDYRLSTPCNVLSWATPVGIYYDYNSSKKTVLPEYDGTFDVVCHGRNVQILAQVEAAGKMVNTTAYPAFGYCGRSGCGMNSCCFAMAISLETSNGMEIAGLNAEEQSDISITMRWSKSQAAGMDFLVYTYYDAMIVLFENNVVQLIK